MVLISLAIVFAGLGAMSLSSSDSEAADTETSTSAAATTTPVTSAAVPPSTTSAAAGSSTTTTPPTSTTAAGPDHTVPVRVLNNSRVQGLAKQTADELTADGWNVAEVGNYANDTIPNTTVYYGNSAGEREVAQAIAAAVGGSAQPRPGGLTDLGTGVIVILAGN